MKQNMHGAQLHNEKSSAQTELLTTKLTNNAIHQGQDKYTSKFDVDKSARNDQQILARLFDDTTALERLGTLRRTIYPGDVLNCAGCLKNIEYGNVRHAIHWGNAKGPSVSLIICRRCYRNRSRLVPALRRVWDHSCVQRSINGHRAAILEGVAS